MAEIILNNLVVSWGLPLKYDNSGIGGLEIKSVPFTS